MKKFSLFSPESELFFVARQTACDELFLKLVLYNLRLRTIDFRIYQFKKALVEPYYTQISALLVNMHNCITKLLLLAE